MGAERKRGKLAEFNRLLRGATDTSFVVQHGETSILPVRPLRDHARLRHAAADGSRPAAGRHAVASAEPAALRRPPAARHRRLRRAAAAHQRQRRQRQPDDVLAECSPGTSASIPTRRRCPISIRTCFTRAATSARASTTSTRSSRRSPGACRRTRCSATTSSKGFYARAGLVTDIDLVDDYPGSYLAYSARQHRWVRGDWQIARWLWRTVPDAARQDRRQYAAGHLALEDPRQPAAQPDSARRSCCSSRSGGRSCRDRPRSGRRSCCSCWRSPPTSSSRARSAATSPGVPLREHLRAERRHDR